MSEYEDGDADPLSERLSGIEHANKFVLDELHKEQKSIPGFFSYVLCIAIYGAIFWQAFGNWPATVGLTLLPVLILSYEADRRRSDIRLRRLIEYQNGIIRSVFANQQHLYDYAVRSARHDDGVDL